MPQLCSISTRHFIAGLGVTLLIGASLWATTGCLPEHDFERPVYDRGTLGHELYLIWHKDTARSATLAPERVAMLEANYTDFVGAVDTIAPPQDVGSLDRFLQNGLEMVDDGLMPGVMRKVYTAFEEASRDQELLAAMSDDFKPAPQSFVSPRHPSAFLSHFMNYPEISDLTQRSMALVVASDGFDDQGNVDFIESSAISDLLRDWKRSLASDESADQDPADRMAIVMRDLLLVQDARFAPVPSPGSPNAEPIYAVIFDERGFPRASYRNNEIAFPFVDHDGDGLADIDSQGDFILRDGSTASIPAFSTDGGLIEPVARDQFGRATRGSENTEVFDYVDLNQTGLSYLARTTSKLSESAVLHDLLASLPTALGPAAAHEDELGAYIGYGDDHPLLDVVYALFNALDIETLPEFLEAAASFLNQSDAAVAGLFHAIQHASEAIGQHPLALLEDNQTLIYDLLPVLREVAEDPALWADVMAALRNPILKRSGEPMHKLLTHKDTHAVPAPGGPYDRCFETCRDRNTIGTDARLDCLQACPQHEIFATAMDFGSPESETNRSMLQRLFHLLRDTAGVPYVMNIEEAHVPGVNLPPNLPPMITLPGSAEAFIAAVAGNLRLADYISQEFTDSDIGQLIQFLDQVLPGTIGNNTIAAALSGMSALFGAHLDTTPTPDQITRLFNQEDMRFEDGDIVMAVTNPVCRDHYVMALHHADGLYAAEASGLIDVLYPLAKAFSDHGREELLAELFVIVHNHYTSKPEIYYTALGTPSAMKGSNLVSFEPALVKILADGVIFEALYDLSVVMHQARGPDGIGLEEHLRRFLHQALRTDDGFTGRRGQTHLELADGRMITELSRFHVFLDGLKAAADRLVPGSPAWHSFEDALDGIFESLMTAEKPTEGPARFTDPGGLALLSHTTSYLAGRARTKRSRNELSAWLTEVVPRETEAFFTSRTLFALLRLGHDAFKEPENRVRFDDFVQYLMDNPESTNQAVIATYLLLVKAVDTDSWKPIARYLVGILDPDRDWAVQPLGGLPLVSHLAMVMQRSAALDPTGDGFALLARGFTPTTTAPAPFDVLIGILADYYRQAPSSTAPMSARDYASSFQGFAAWMADPDHGLEKVFKLVQMRSK